MSLTSMAAMKIMTVKKIIKGGAAVLYYSIKHFGNYY
ncbi:MAG: hypothetical protein BWY69_00328 [Planctomycetes bacterium ADurb.Bin401]|nr:MAG: hypothetical protein BWY69_00328 [Planctomycetes bacterium ADurb.Bin401]